ncbi:MAG: hypothetical protein AAF567_15760 [Actinomycetota bacterium]
MERGEGLTDAQRAALDFCDALITQPGAIEDSLRARLYEHFTEDQIVELALDVMKWSYQKAAVVLGTDAELATGELTDLAFDDNGDWIR